MTEQKKLRIGIVGLGNIGKAHAGNILRGAVPNLVLTAACRPIRLCGSPSIRQTPKWIVFRI